MSKISGLVITFNEEHNIAECIASLNKVCDDIVVVDSCSSDKTVSIAEALGAKVISQPFLGDGPQRIKGLQYCKHDWVLNLDADERLEDDALNQISAIDFSNKTYDVYEFRRHNLIGGKFTKYAGQYPDYVARLFNKNTANFSPVSTHTRVKGQKHKTLASHILHYSYKDYADLFQRQCKYANWMAKEYATKNRNVSVFAPFIHGTWSFFRHYFVKLGFIAGVDGLTISIAKAIGAYLKYAQALQLSKKNNQPS